MSPPISGQRRTSTVSAPHYTWGAGCDGWHLVRTPDLSVIEERMPPRATDVRHRHRNARQFFYVLRGELTVDCGGERHVMTAGLGLEIAPGVPHQPCNQLGRRIIVARYGSALERT